ncbi:MAG: amidase family protein [Candidatus Dormibacteria bacterium]
MAGDGNPRDESRVAGGAAGAAAIGSCWGTTAGDIGGFVRIPASLCSVAGLKRSLATINVTRVLPMRASHCRSGDEY